MQRFLSELQRRKVLRVASAYVVGGWIILQVALALQTAMNLPAWFSTVIVSLLIIGFPIALVASWFLEITPEGIKRTVASGDGALVKPQTTDSSSPRCWRSCSSSRSFRPSCRARARPPQPPPRRSAETKPEPPALGDKSIAVLPFANLSPDKEDAFFADGLTEEVLNILAQRRGMKVISRTSSFAFKGKDMPSPRSPNGSAFATSWKAASGATATTFASRRSSSTSQTDAHIWSQTFERTLADVFAVQDDIARAIAGALNIELSLSAGQRGAPTENMEAYRLYLKARADDPDLERKPSRRHRSVQTGDRIGPEFAEAYAHMASVIGGYRIYDPANGAALTCKAYEAVNAAIKLKPDNATARAVLGSLASVHHSYKPLVALASGAAPTPNGQSAPRQM